MTMTYDQVQEEARQVWSYTTPDDGETLEDFTRTLVNALEDDGYIID